MRLEEENGVRGRGTPWRTRGEKNKLQDEKNAKYFWPTSTTQWGQDCKRLKEENEMKEAVELRDEIRAARNTNCETRRMWRTSDHMHSAMKPPSEAPLRRERDDRGRASARRNPGCEEAR